MILRKKTVKNLYQFKKYLNCLSQTASIYLQNKCELWLIGGCDYWHQAVDDIHSYSMKHNKWKLLNVNYQFH